MTLAKLNHPAELRIAQLLESGACPTVQDLGGADLLLKQVEDLVGSRLSAEFIAVVLRCDESAQETLAPFVQKLLSGLATDLVYMEVVDLLEQRRPLPKRLHQVCFDALLETAGNEGRDAMVRASALDGAMRLAAGKRPQELRLVAQLLETSADEEPVYLVRAAKVVGMLNAFLTEPGLPECLRRLADVPDDAVAAEAAHELGMVALGEALDAAAERDVLGGLAAASHWFSVAIDRSETRPESDVFRLHVDFLMAFREGKRRHELRAMSAQLSHAVFAMQRSRSSDSPSWLGLRQAQTAYLNALTVKLTQLDAVLEESGWWEPARVVEDVLLSAYTANRTILRRHADGGVDVLVQPRIRASLVQERGQAAVVRHWVQTHATHEWRNAADDLLAEVDRIVPDDPSRPSMAVTQRSNVIAVVEGSGIPSDKKRRVLDALDCAAAMHLAKLSGAEAAVIERCISCLSECPEYSHGDRFRALMDTVLVWTLRFLVSRIDASREHDSSHGYLFEPTDGRLPRESKLQDDYQRFMVGVGMGSEIEVSNIAAGRCDVRFTLGGETVVTEVKRELNDASFSNLATQYAAQASEYQTTGGRAGVLLTLDLVTCRTQGLPHLSELVEARRIVRGLMDSRWLVFVLVPGRRVVPSATRGAALS